MIAHEVVTYILLVILIICLVAIAVITIIMGFECHSLGGTFLPISGVCIRE